MGPGRKRLMRRVGRLDQARFLRVLESASVSLQRHPLHAMADSESDVAALHALLQDARRRISAHSRILEEFSARASPSTPQEASAKSADASESQLDTDGVPEESLSALLLCAIPLLETILIQLSCRGQDHDQLRWATGRGGVGPAAVRLRCSACAIVGAVALSCPGAAAQLVGHPALIEALLAPLSSGATPVPLLEATVEALCDLCASPAGCRALLAKGCQAVPSLLALLARLCPTSPPVPSSRPPACGAPHFAVVKQSTGSEAPHLTLDDQPASSAPNEQEIPHKCSASTSAGLALAGARVPLTGPAHSPCPMCDSNCHCPGESPSLGHAHALPEQGSPVEIQSDARSPGDLHAQPPWLAELLGTGEADADSGDEGSRKSSEEESNADSDEGQEGSSSPDASPSSSFTPSSSADSGTEAAGPLLGEYQEGEHVQGGKEEMEEKRCPTAQGAAGVQPHDSARGFGAQRGSECQSADSLPLAQPHIKSWRDAIRIDSLLSSCLDCLAMLITCPPDLLGSASGSASHLGDAIPVHASSRDLALAMSPSSISVSATVALSAYSAARAVHMRLQRWPHSQPGAQPGTAGCKSEKHDGAVGRVATVLAWLGMLCASLGLDVNEEGTEELQNNAAPGAMRHTAAKGGVREPLEGAAEGTGQLEHKKCCERTITRDEASCNDAAKGRASLECLLGASAAQVDWFLQMCWEERPVVFRKSMAIESTTSSNGAQARSTILEVTQSVGPTETVASRLQGLPALQGPRQVLGRLVEGSLGTPCPAPWETCPLHALQAAASAGLGEGLREGRDLSLVRTVPARPQFTGSTAPPGQQLKGGSGGDKLPQVRSAAQEPRRAEPCQARPGALGGDEMIPGDGSMASGRQVSATGATLGQGPRGASGSVGPTEMNVGAGQRGGPRAVRESQVEEEEQHFWHNMAKSQQHHLQQATRQQQMSKELLNNPELRGREGGQHKDVGYRKRAAQSGLPPAHGPAGGAPCGPAPDSSCDPSSRRPMLLTDRDMEPPFHATSQDEAPTTSPGSEVECHGGGTSPSVLEPGGLVPVSICTAAYKAGFSLALRGLSRRMRPVAAVCRGLARCFSQATVGANLYLTPPGGSQGLARHEDDHCVFVCQLFGTKWWRVYSPLAPVGKHVLPRLYSAGMEVRTLHGEAHQGLAEHAVGQRGAISGAGMIQQDGGDNGRTRQQHSTSQISAAGSGSRGIAVERKELGERLTANGACSEAKGELQDNEAAGMGGSASPDGTVLCLNPGDVLYIPRGFAHHAATAPAGSVPPRPESDEQEHAVVTPGELDAGASLHVTFGVEVEGAFENAILMPPPPPPWPPYLSSRDACLGCSWEGLLHIALHLWFLSLHCQCKSEANTLKCISGEPQAHHRQESSHRAPPAKRQRCENHSCTTCGGTHPLNRAGGGCSAIGRAAAGPQLWAQAKRKEQSVASGTVPCRGAQSDETPPSNATRGLGRLLCSRSWLWSELAALGECLSGTAHPQQQAAECIAEGGATNGMPLAGPGPADTEGPREEGEPMGSIARNMQRALRMCEGLLHLELRATSGPLAPMLRRAHVLLNLGAQGQYAAGTWGASTDGIDRTSVGGPVLHSTAESQDECSNDGFNRVHAAGTSASGSTGGENSKREGLARPTVHQPCPHGAVVLFRECLQQYALHAPQAEAAAWEELLAPEEGPGPVPFGAQRGDWAWGGWLALLRTEPIQTGTDGQLAPTVSKDNTRERPGLGCLDGKGGAMEPSYGAGTCAFDEAEGGAYVVNEEDCLQVEPTGGRPPASRESPSEHELLRLDCEGLSLSSMLAPLTRAGGTPCRRYTSFVEFKNTMGCLRKDEAALPKDVADHDGKRAMESGDGGNVRGRLAQLCRELRGLFLAACSTEEAAQKMYEAAYEEQQRLLGLLRKSREALEEGLIALHLHPAG